MREVYLHDNEEAIQVLDAQTNEILYYFSYRHQGNLIWNHTDAWRILREQHLQHDQYREVFKCKCGKTLKLPKTFQVRSDELNNIEYDLTCECGEKITIQCDTLKIKEDKE